MDKKIILITGTTSGIGLETAKQLAKQDLHIVMANRNMEKSDQLRDLLRGETGNEHIDSMYIDMASLTSIQDFADAFISKYKRLDVLINNAGLFSDTKKFTQDGFELTMGVNFLGTYYLTELLLETIKKAQEGRILFVSSKAGYYGKVKLKEDYFIKHAHGFKAYSASKLAVLYYTRYLAGQLKDTRVTVNAIHPGQVSTNIWKGESILMKIVGPINKKKYDAPAIACETPVYLATAEVTRKVSGKLFEKKNQIMAYNKRILDDQAMVDLMAYTKMVIQRFQKS